MTVIAVTGATGQFGSAAVRTLLGRGVAADSVVAVVRNAEKAADLAAKGVIVRVADYTDPAALRTALDGVDRLLLVSGSEVGQREVQHRNVIAAAEKAGVSLIAYTSLLRADTSTIGLAPEHVATEQMLAASPLAAVVLRNTWYWENYAASIESAAQSGVLLGSGGAGRIAGAARADLAEAAALVISAPEGSADLTDGTVLELAGPAVTYPELADALARVSGAEITYRDVTSAEHAEVLTGAGLPAPVVDLLVNADAGIARGDLYSDSDDLARVLGRAPRTAEQALQAAAG
ncbi:NmrA family NAD(P)-binding protein [Rhodococcoides corynebacterioides]|uniref:NmrA family NAD(P)-binding protein n=1 Tax=Rhodococcoides corynebacterioides TaxID=53972 RepID=UPI001C9B7B27|nr:NAD(P)H-binding protein [Rhodococcus corynebacterioides]MBY6352207.1 NmrA family NAD(P)-binding protein [Rhodococcus corynebacterioides]